MKKIGSAEEYRRLFDETGHPFAPLGTPENKRFHEIAGLLYDYENEVFQKIHGRPPDRDSLHDVKLLADIVVELTGLERQR